MPDYKQGKIYALRSYKIDDIYIGSTTQILSQRLGGHKKNYKRWLNGKTNWCSSFEIIKQGDCYIELIEYADCKSRAELLKKEGQFIRKMDCVNKNIAGRDLKQYYIDNKEKMKEYKKQYHKDNREKITERQKKYYQNTKQERLKKQKEYYEKNKELIKQRKKAYREKNKDAMNAKHKAYREKNKDAINARCRELYHEKKLKKKMEKEI